MSRQLAVAAATAALLVTALAGCGIPDETDVRVDGVVPATQRYGSRDGVTSPPPERTDSDIPKQFVANFLAAGAGETSRAYERIRDYIAPNKRDSLKKKEGADVVLNVVRPTKSGPLIEENPDGTSSITLAVQQVGQLRSDGSLSPPVSNIDTYRFTVGRASDLEGVDPNGARGLYVLDPPSVLLLSDEALQDFYQKQPIYFWNNERTALVPDLRYLPNEVPPERLATDVLDWLSEGPSDWLSSTVVRLLPDGIERLGTAPQNGDRLEVNLSASPANEEAELDRLAYQLAWSLPNQGGELEFMVRNQSRKVIDIAKYRDGKSVYSSVTQQPERFCVYAEAVHRLGDPGTPTPAPQDTVPLSPDVNRDVVSAAISRGGVGVLAALVTDEGRGRLRLKVGTDPTKVSKLSPSDTTYSSMGRPVWLKTGDQRRSIGLVVADGKLYRFTAGNARLVQVVLPGDVGAVTSVGAALDGNRIAFTAGGKLRVATVAIDGGDSDTATDLEVTVNAVRQLSTSLQSVVAVDWRDSTTLDVAGINPENERATIYSVTVDGALEGTLVEETGAEVTHLAAFPLTPNFQSTYTMMFVANEVTWLIQYVTPERIKSKDVAGVTASPPAGGSTDPSAPFYYY